VYLLGARIGTFRGDCSRPGKWYVETASMLEMPPEAAAALGAIDARRSAR
jgi:hypothetical protein